MKKRSRRPRHTGRTPSVGQEKKATRGRPRKAAAVPADGLYGNASAKYSETAVGDAQQHLEGKSRSSGRLSTAVCRLCHGKFSPRSLRHAFVKFPRDSAHPAAGADAEESDAAGAAVPSALLFHSDFQRLVGVPLDRNPGLSDFVCKKCHAKFYKCHGILRRFLQRVNLPPPAGPRGPRTRTDVKSPESSQERPAAPASFSSDPKCLLGLVSWAHRHGEACRSCPDLKEVLEGQCWGSVRAVWGCVDGHRYTMDTRYAAAAASAPGLDANPSGNGEGVMSEGEEEEEEEQQQQTPSAGNPSAPVQQSPPMENWSSRAEEFSGQEEAPSPSAALLDDRAADSDLSDRAGSDEEFEEGSKGGDLDEELFDPYAEKRVNASNKRRRSPKAPEEPKVKKKPGPKPGWKNKFKPKGEDLPNIYKCPYQGCVAVYRAPDGLKKHIKEHHEEVRQRPCPHPGCNKVFMIDRYLQRHVKLIHTEERNYICDQCGQTFKQRKHLSVHQMRHSGAKPLQCEVCGFQCRQRASLKYHMTKHKAEADLEFECLMCRKRFEKAHNLNVHMSMVHPLTQAELQRGGDQQQQGAPRQLQQQQAAAAAYPDLNAIPLSGEVVQQEQDR